MIVRTYWPGATIDDTMLQVTDRIEKKLQETPSLYYLKSETKAGVSTRYSVHVLDGLHPEGGDPGHLVSGPQEGHRHQIDIAARHFGAEFQ